jgi:hypothetical protein
MKSKLWVLLICFHCLGFAVTAQTVGKRQQILQVSSGGFISFKSQTSAADSNRITENQSLASLIHAQTVADENRIIHRVITDGEGRVIFGYDLRVNSDPFTRKFSLVVLPADEAFRRTFLKDSAAKRAEDLFATFPKSATPQTLDDGDAVSVELLVNQESGLKIVDVVRVTFDRSSLLENHFESTPKDFTLDAVALSVKGYQLLIDGDLVVKSKATVGCTGSLLWLYVPGRGRFIFSLVPRDGYEFEKVGVIDGNRIEFVVDGKSYEWLSEIPILSSGGTWNLWVLRDQDYTPLFSSEKTITQGLSVFQKLDRIVTLGAGDDVKFKPGGSTIPRMPNPSTNKSQVVIPPRVMIGGADTMENLLPKGP